MFQWTDVSTVVTLKLFEGANYAMSVSHETYIKNKIDKGDPPSKKIEISILKYFWQANPLTKSSKETIPRFLKNIAVFKNVTDNELRILSSFMHHRHFTTEERIFSQNEIGIGFYFIFNGHVDIIVDDSSMKGKAFKNKTLLSLGKYECFGELALLQEGNVRTAHAIANTHCELIGIFRPDLEILIQEHPIIASKLLQSISRIIADKLHCATSEIKRLQDKLHIHEREPS